MKSALFVDFDNVFTQLRALDPHAAERFARQPGAWMRWLTDQLQIPEGHDPEARRRVLVRRCYLNPNWYRDYRHAFLRAGFEIVDCPPVTSQGKTSTDIHMVLDIIELLQHETRYDEFVVLSADADFTPVLRKLRRYDRRTTVLAIGFPSAAYQASADLLIDERLFIEQALDLGELPAEPAPGPAAPPADMPPPPMTSVQLQAVARQIEQLVGEAVQPVPVSGLVQRLRQAHGPLLDGWNGHGTFKPFFRSLGLDRLQWLSGSGGRLADPERHATHLAAALDAETGEAQAGAALRPPVDAEPFDPPDPLWAGHAALLPLAREVSQFTGAPLLPPPVVRAVLDALCADLAQHAYEPTETARRVCSACQQRTPPMPVALRDVVFLLRGMQLNGHVFGRGLDDVATLTQRLFNQVQFLCQREQLPLPVDSLALLRQWLVGDLPAARPPPGTGVA